MAGTRRLTGARRARFPEFIEPCHPTLVSRAPAGPRWLHEIKVDGYRCQLHIGDRKVKAFTRRGYDWAPRFRSIADAAESLPVSEAIIDGEVIVPGEGNLSDFAALQTELAGGRSERLAFYAFDLLYLDGLDLRGVALAERKQRLQQLIERARSSRFVFAEEFEGDGEALHARVCTAGLEGLVSKLRHSRYQSGRNESWVKVTCRKRDTFLVCGFIPAPGRSLNAVYVARSIGGKLIYAGKAAAGFTGDTARALRQRLDPLVRKTSPLEQRVKKPKSVWVEPEIEVDLEYRGITGDGRLRHATFKRVREDLMRPRMRGGKSNAVKRLKYNIQRLLPDAVVPGKDELREYWRKAGKAALQYIGGRPLTLVRHVDGITFFHTRKLPQMPRPVHAMHFEKREGGEGVRAYVDSVQGLLGLVDMDVIEVHPWNATVDDIEHPDQMIFDLDPHEGVPWEFVTRTAVAMRALLKQQGLDPWPKGTGGKGLHVMVPIKPERSHDEVAAIAKKLASEFAKSDSRYTTSNVVARRAGKIFIDYLRNGRGQTGIGAFSPRARRNFPIAAPFSWSEVERNLPSDAYTVHRLPPL